MKEQTALKDIETVDNCKETTFNPSKFDNKKLKSMRIKNLRSLRSKKTLVPNLKAKLWALRMMDEITGGKAISLPGQERATLGPPSALGCTRDTLSTRVQQVAVDEDTSLPLGRTRDTLSEQHSGHRALGGARTTLRPAEQIFTATMHLGGARTTLRPTEQTSTSTMSLGRTRDTLSAAQHDYQRVLGGACTTLKLENESTDLLENSDCEVPPIQSTDPSKYTIVGNDVEAYFLL